MNDFSGLRLSFEVTFLTLGSVKPCMASDALTSEMFWLKLFADVLNYVKMHEIKLELNAVE